LNIFEVCMLWIEGISKGESYIVVELRGEQEDGVAEGRHVRLNFLAMAHRLVHVGQRDDDRAGA
jgi:hypothetical protein